MDRTSTNGNVKPSGVTHRYTRPGFNPKVGEHKKIMVIHDEFCAIMPHVEYLFLSRILNLADSPGAIIDGDGWLLLQSDFMRRHYHFTPRHQKTIVANLTKLGFLRSEGRNSHGGQRQRWVKVNVEALDEAIRASLEAEGQPPQSRLSSDPEPLNGRPRDDKRPSAEEKVLRPEPLNGRPEPLNGRPEPLNGRPEPLNGRPRDDKRLSRSMETDIQTDMEKKNQTEEIRTPPQRPPVHYFDPRAPYTPERGEEDEKLPPSGGLPATLGDNVSSGISGVSFFGGKKTAQGGDAPHQKDTSGAQRAQQKSDDQLKQPPSERVARAVLDTRDTLSPYKVGENNLTSEEKRFTPAEWRELAKRENIRQRDVVDIIAEWTDRRAKWNIAKRDAEDARRDRLQSPVPPPPKRDQSPKDTSSTPQQEGSPSAWADALCAAASRLGYAPKAYKRLAWEKEFSALALRVGDDARVARAVAWYCQNAGGDFVPIANTAVAFAAKFDAIEAAMRRAPKHPAAAQTGPLPRTEDGLWLERDLEGIDFPTAPDHPTFVDMLEGSLAFLHSLRDALRDAVEGGTLPSDRHEYAAEAIHDAIQPLSLTRRWLEDTQRHYKHRKSAWGGKPGVMGLGTRFLQDWVEGILDRDGRPAWLWGEIKPHLGL